MKQTYQRQRAVERQAEQCVTGAAESNPQPIQVTPDGRTAASDVVSEATKPESSANSNEQAAKEKPVENLPTPTAKKPRTAPALPDLEY